MEYGITPWNMAKASASNLSEQAVFAEQLGYRSFWLPENHFNPQAIPDPLMLLAGIAAATTTIKLATTSYLLPLRNPLLAAEQVAILDHLSEGRVLLGVGRGYSKETLRAFDINPGDKREIFEWSLDLIRRAWKGETISLHDDGLASVEVLPTPLQKPHPPVWIAAFGPKALGQAGRLGLPYFASPIDTLETLKKNYSRFDEAVERAGNPKVSTRPFMRTVFTSENSSVIKRLRKHLVQMELPRGLKTSPALDEWAVVGSREFVSEKLHEYEDTLKATHLVITHFRFEGIEESELRRSVEILSDFCEK